MLAHNHPVCPLEPSETDIETTRRLREAGKIMGITLLDHIIFNQSGYFSFVEEGTKFSYE
ncbi:MAG: hypothetical protein JRI87_10675 [Deltaproteobacteria bacterium]|nr:hypothetical protein [Deltaproteobacteria bacterium]